MARFGVNARIRLMPGGVLDFDAPLNQMRQRILDNDQLKRRSRNLQPVFDHMGRYYERRFEDAFRREGTRTARWQPLAPATVREKQRLGFGGKGILERTGRLRRSYRYRATPRTLQISFSRNVRGVNLFDIHQYGTTHIPARPMIQPAPRDEAELTRKLREHLYG